MGERMKIIRIDIQTNRRAADMITIHTNLPSPMPNVTKDCASFMTLVEIGHGEEYVRKNFPYVSSNDIKIIKENDS